MAHYSLLITSSPFDQTSGTSPIEFAQALIEADHTLDQIFFYQAGVYHANEFAHEPGNQSNQYQRWVELKAQLDVPLWVCVTAAAKRGVISEHEAQELGKSGFNIAAPFEQVGIGEFFAKLHQSDHLVHF